MVDAQASEACPSNGVEVRLLSSALIFVYLNSLRFVELHFISASTILGIKTNISPIEALFSEV